MPETIGKIRKSDPRQYVTECFLFKQVITALVMIDLICRFKTHGRWRSRTRAIVYCQIDCVENYSKKSQVADTRFGHTKTAKVPKGQFPCFVLARRGPIREARKRRLSPFFVVARPGPICDSRKRGLSLRDCPHSLLLKCCLMSPEQSVTNVPGQNLIHPR